MASNTPVTIDSTRLEGGWLWIVRIVWVVGVGLQTAMNLLGVVAVKDVLSQPCVLEPCSLRQQTNIHSMDGEVHIWPGPPIGYPNPLRPDEIQVIESLNLTLEQYGWISAGILGVSALVYLLLAIGLAWQKPDDRMVLFVSFMIASLPNIHSPLGFTLTVQQPEWKLIFDVASAIGLICFIGFPLIFPTGKFVPGWARWIAAYIVIGAISLIAARQYAFEIEFLIVAGYLFPSFAMAAFAQIYRYKKVASPTEQQQLKWVVSGLVGFFAFNMMQIAFAATAGVSIETALVTSLGNPAWSFFFSAIPDLLFSLFSFFIPVSITIAAMRYRLWEINFVINRALVYGTLTASLAGLFAASFFALNSLLQNFIGQEQVILSAGISAALGIYLFNPARRWLRSFIDSRLFGIQIDYTPSAASKESGPTLTHFGTYNQLEFIGRGGMANVYRATDPGKGHLVAVKILNETLSADPEFRKRFEREARIASMLQHPNIVPVYESGEVGGTPYMVMQYIHGQDLGETIRSSGRLALKDAMPIIEGIADALEYAHSKGLVHRDIKPSNIMMDGSTPLITDFGIAKILDGNTKYTQTGGVLGTFDYISPEQIQGAADIDSRADIYSFGALVYQLVTGKKLFSYQNPGALLIAHLSQPVPNPRDFVPELPRQAAYAIQKALAKKPQERFASAREFATELKSSD